MIKGYETMAIENQPTVKYFNLNLYILTCNIPYERRNAAAALQQFTFTVAQRLSVCKAVLVSR